MPPPTPSVLPREEGVRGVVLLLLLRCRGGVGWGGGARGVVPVPSSLGREGRLRGGLPPSN